MVLRKLKRLLGLDSSSSSKRRVGRDVTVRDDRTDDEADDDAEPATTTGSGPGTTGTEPETGADAVTEPDVTDASDAAAETGAEPDEHDGRDTTTDATDRSDDADASTESLVDDEPVAETPDAAAEPAETARPTADDTTSDIEEAESDAAAAGGTPVDEVKGIGPAYSDRLGEIGIESAEELADADPSDVAGRISVPEKTVRKWIDRADDR